MSVSCGVDSFRNAVIALTLSLFKHYKLIFPLFNNNDLLCWFHTIQSLYIKYSLTQNV